MRTKLDINWNLGDIQPSVLYKTSIAIKSDYEWGDGWTMQQANRFEAEVYPRLKEEGFEIQYPYNRGSSIRSCPLLVGEKAYDKTNLYLHPMEFSGYISKNDCDKVMKALSECECIYDTKISYQKECYDISNQTYEDMILENIHTITEGYKEFCKENGYKLNANSMMEFGLEFAREYRLPRVGDKSGLTSSDVDVRAITNMLKVAKELGYMDKEKSKNQMKNREGAER